MKQEFLYVIEEQVGRMSAEISGTEAAQRGNVLFLILIAVALFAALSYAVTSSTRSGDGNASKETTAVEGAWLQNYGSALASAITRMRVNQSIATTDLCFFAPANSLYSNTSYQSQNVFHPKGGNALYEEPPKTLAADGATGFGLGISIASLPNVGTSGATGSDVILLIQGLKKSTCDAVNKRVNTPLYQSLFFVIDPLAAGYSTGCIYSLPYLGAMTPAAYPGLSGSHEGCVENSLVPGLYYYYRVLVER